MATTAVEQGRPVRQAVSVEERARWREPVFQAYLLLRAAFVLAPVLFGIDKFFNWMTFWPKYLWIGFPHLFGVTPQQFIYGVGAVEIAAGLLVLLLPRYAPYLVAGWLAGIVVDLVVKSIAVGGHTAVFWDIALRDTGLMLGALALARLAAVFTTPPRASWPIHRGRP